MNKTISAALVALVALAASASAQVQANLNDLVLGFRATGGQGQNLNLEVDLGSISRYSGLPAGTVLTVSQLAPLDLSGAYGASWSTRSDLFWGIVGTTGRISGGPGGQPVSTIWATNAQTTVGTQSAVWTPGSRSAQTNASAGIEPLILGAPGSLNGASVTGNSTSASLVTATLAGSYTSQDTFQPGTSFGFFNPSIDNSAKVATGTYAVSDLYELRVGDTTARYIGSFGLSPQGNLIFANSPTYFASANGAPVATPSGNQVQSVTIGGGVTFSVSATGSGLSYQWFKGTTVISGQTNSTLTLSNVTAADAASYSVAVKNSVATVTVSGYSLTVSAVQVPSRLINLSVLTSLGTGENLQVGFVVGGAGTSGTKAVLARAMGPSLASFNVTGFLPNPTMGYYTSGNLISSNTKWGGDAALVATSAAVGAFPFVSTTSLDSALNLTNVPSGNNSVVVTGAGTTTSGQVLAELYDATPGSSVTATTPRLINVSIIKNVGTGLTVGFVVSGSSPRNVLIRAVGPTLATAPFNVTGVMTDPKLVLTSGGNPVATNDDWSAAGGTATATNFSQVGAFALPAGSKDAAIYMSLQPGTYQAAVSASTGTTGVALVEVYEAP